MKFFYRIYKRKKHERQLNVIKNVVVVDPPIVKFTTLTNTYQNKKIKSKCNELQNVEPRHELKIIISKKPNKSNDKVLSTTIPNKIVVKDFKQLRSNDDKIMFSTTTTSATSSSASPSTSTSSNETKALLNKITITKQLKNHKKEDTKNPKNPDRTKTKLNKYLIEENSVDKQKIVIKKLKRENSTPSNYCYINKPLAIKNEMPSLKTKISVSKQHNESYCITPSPSLAKKVKFSFPIDDNITETLSPITNDLKLMQNEYAQKIGLKRVEKKVDSILLHRKRKKSKHSKNIDIKRQKHRTDSTSTNDISLKLKITKSTKTNDVANNSELRCNSDDMKEYVINKTATVVEPTKSTEQKEQQKFLLSHKINSNALQPMVFIPKLNLKATNELLNVNNVMEQLNNTEIKTKSVVDCRDLKQTDVVMSDTIFIKPSRAKMGSPNNNNKKTHPKQFMAHQTYFKPRSHSIPSTLKLSPISSYSQMDYQKKPGINIEGFNNSQNRFLNNDLFSPGYETMPNINNHPLRNTLKMPPLVPASCNISDQTSNLINFNNHSKANEAFKTIKSNSIPTLSYTANTPINATFKKPQAVDILRVPTTNINRIKYSPMAAMEQQQQRPIKFENFKINRPQLCTIPLDKIKQSHQNANQTTISNKINYYDNMPKLVSYQTSNLNKEKHPSSMHLHRDNNPDILDFSSKYDQFILKNDFHNDEITKMIEDQSGLSKDIISYEMELSKDIAKLDQRLSVEKNIEQHSKTHEKNLSVRNIPNPSALLFRNTNNFKQNDGIKYNLMKKTDIANKSYINDAIKEKATMFTDFNDKTDIEEMLKTTTILPISNNPLSKLELEHAIKMKSVAKKTLEKLVEHLHVNSKKVFNVAPMIPLNREENDKNNNEDKIINNNNNNNNNNNKDNNNNSNSNDRKVSNCKLNDIICIDV